MTISMAFQTTEMNSLTALEARNQKQVILRATLPPKALWDNSFPFQFLAAPGFPWLVAALLQPQSLPSPLCMYLKSPFLS